METNDAMKDTKEETGAENEAPKAKRLLYRGIQGRIVYICLLLLFFTELVLSYFLYEYISSVEKRCVEIDVEVLPTKVTRKRRSPVLEDNAVSTSEDATVEFFNPKLKHELNEKNGGKHSGNKFKNNGYSTSSASADVGGTSTPSDEENANNPWVWLTSYSRIPSTLDIMQLRRT
ncbi:hypothetical protein RUM43_004113 [Polyplax serrata]|uniref:Uncharacterized protein n=2 Tax=Polyplax serrata TaxID=468196 RepID=A0AAN8XMN8_POLSC